MSVISVFAFALGDISPGASKWSAMHTSLVSFHIWFEGWAKYVFQKGSCPYVLLWTTCQMHNICAYREQSAYYGPDLWNGGLLSQLPSPFPLPYDGCFDSGLHPHAMCARLTCTLSSIPAYKTLAIGVLL